jgi:hypothetical protein
VKKKGGLMGGKIVSQKAAKVKEKIREIFFNFFKKKLDKIEKLVYNIKNYFNSRQRLQKLIKKVF